MGTRILSTRAHGRNSLGFATYGRVAIDLDDLLRRADDKQ
jgi:hypothetical protein